MNIESVELLSLKVPLHTPFKTALREVTHIHDLVVRISAGNDLVGYGSAPSTLAITGEDHNSTYASIKQVLEPLLIGQSINRFDDLLQQVAQAENTGVNAKAAIDTALFDLYARINQVPLHKLINKLSETPSLTIESLARLETDYTISVNNAEQMCADIDTATSRGYRYLKIKIGNEPVSDLQRLKSIHNHIKSMQDKFSKLVLRLDVNQGWDVATAINIVRELEANHILFELIEQPLLAADIEGMIKVKKAIATPIMADESAFNLEQVKYLHAYDAADIMNIKLIKTGGIYPAIKIADYCRKHKITCMMGCMLEGSIGVAAASHFAYAYRDVVTLIDLDGPTLGQYDPIVGATIFKDANITLNNSHGLGISAHQMLPSWRQG